MSIEKVAYKESFVIKQKLTIKIKIKQEQTSTPCYLH